MGLTARLRFGGVWGSLRSREQQAAVGQGLDEVGDIPSQLASVQIGKGGLQGVGHIVDRHRMFQQAPDRRAHGIEVMDGDPRGVGQETLAVHFDLGGARRLVRMLRDQVAGRNDSSAIGATPSPTHEHHNDLVTRSVELAPELGLTVEWEAGTGEYRRRVNAFADAIAVVLDQVQSRQWITIGPIGRRHQIFTVFGEKRGPFGKAR